MNEKSLNNLKKFSSEYQPEKNGRNKGSKNRSTIARRWLEVNQSLKNPLTGEQETMSQEDLMTLALIKKAREGDVTAYKALMDSGYGAPLQQIEQTNIEQPLFPDVQENDVNQ
jgi:hypothetical protein